ncbi:Uncharacterised protein [Pragia fontium]|nr:Uncharacterised protein [Pragia fontium]
MFLFSTIENVDEAGVGRLFYLLLCRRILMWSIFLVSNKHKQLLFFEHDHINKV